MGLRRAGLLHDLKRSAKVVLDTSILIYHLEDVRPYSDLTEGALTALAEGSFAGLVSTISLAELLVKPFREGRNEQITRCERFVLSLPNTTLCAPDHVISREAARLRAKYLLKTADALLVATALVEKAAALLTNDHGLRKVQVEGFEVLLLSEYVR